MDVLKHLVTREHSLGTTIHGAYISRTESEVGPTLRDKAMRWIWVLNENFNFQPESFVLAVHIFDTFLLAMKVRLNYLRCVAMTAYFLSIKAVEEDENIPLVNELLEASECGCTKSDILKMEKIILRALKWKIYIATPLIFLQHFYQLFVIHITDFQNISGNMLKEAEEKIQECMCKWQLTQFKSSVLAFAVLELKLKGLLDQNSLLQLQKIRQMAKIDNSQLVQCKLMIKRDDSGEKQETEVSIV